MKIEAKTASPDKPTRIKEENRNDTKADTILAELTMSAPRWQLTAKRGLLEKYEHQIQKNRRMTRTKAYKAK